MWSTIARKLADMVSSHITGKKKSGSGDNDVGSYPYHTCTGQWYR